MSIRDRAVLIRITEEMRQLARDRCKNQPVKPQLERGGENYRGALGVILVEKFLDNKNVLYVDTFDNDLLVNNIKLEVKEETMSVDYPEDSFSFDIVNRPYKQKCDYVAMTVINKFETFGYVLGFLPAEEAFDPKRIIEKGFVNPRNGKKMLRSNYHIGFSEIGDPKGYKKIFLDGGEPLKWDKQ